LSDGINSFIDQCLVGIVANKERITQLLEQSLMLVTALNPYIGYDDGQRVCTNAFEGDTCMSGQIFPKMDICINPRLTP